MSRNCSEAYFCSDRKTEFLNETLVNKDETQLLSPRSRYHRTRTVFLLIAPIEAKLEKDISEFNKADVKKLYAECMSKYSDTTIRDRISLIKDYIKWCSVKGYISILDIARHPLMSATDVVYDSGSVTKSKRIIDQCDAIENNGDNFENFIFRTKDGLFDYLETVLIDSASLMQKACVYLMYYGFKGHEIQSIKMSEVDDRNHTVRGVLIDDNVAFKAILDAKYAKECEIDDGQIYQKVYRYYNTGYLIKSFMKDSKVSDDYIKRIKKTIEMKVDKLPDGSKYRGVYITPSWLFKQHEFHRFLSDHPEYADSKTELNKILRESTEYRIQSADFLMMYARAKDL